MHFIMRSAWIKPRTKTVSAKERPLHYGTIICVNKQV